MFVFEQPKLRLGVAYTRRDTWVNKETEVSRRAIIEKVSVLADEQDIEIYSTEDLEARKKRFIFGGRELSRSNNKYMTDYEDALFAASYFKEKKVDALFIPFCNFGQEEAVAKLGKELNVPLLIWGPRDGIPNPTATMRPTDSQCGIFAASKDLRRYGVKFTYIENCLINDVIFEKGFKTFIQTARIIRSFRHARIAQLSVRPQQFLSVMVNEGELLEKFGIEIVPITGTQLIDTINSIQKHEGEQIDVLLTDIEKTIDLTQLQNKRAIAAIELGIMKIAQQYNCSAVASDCWHTIRHEFGIGPCFVFGDLYDRGLPCTCECDIHGAITSLLAVAAVNNKSAAFLADLTMRHPENDNAELLWHCGPFAKQLKDPDVNGYVIKTGEGHYRIKKGELTVLRFDGDHGNYYCFVGKGQSINGPETGGNYTYLEVDDWIKWEKKFVYGPYVHHVVGIFGDYRDALFEACRYLEIKYDTPDSNPFIYSPK